jgi:hypothetical protein
MDSPDERDGEPKRDGIEARFAMAARDCWTGGGRGDGRRAENALTSIIVDFHEARKPWRRCPPRRA